MAKKVVNPTFAKTRDYGGVLKTIEQTAKCPFCKENFKYHKKPILKREKGWLVTENSWPYKNSKYHFILIPDKHKENFDKLTISDFKTVSKLVSWLIKKYKIKGGGFLLRFGNSFHTGATVCHMHFHIIVPKLEKGKNRLRTVYFPIG